MPKGEDMKCVGRDMHKRIAFRSIEDEPGQLLSPPSLRPILRSEVGRGVATLNRETQHAFRRNIRDSVPGAEAASDELALPI